MRQTKRRKIKIFLHCLVRLHRRGVVPHESFDGKERWTTWACADCAENLVKIRTTLTTSDIEWAKRCDWAMQRSIEIAKRDRI